MSTDTSGANLLPDLPGLPRRHHDEPDVDPGQETASKRTETFRDRWDLLEGISARRARRSERADRARKLRELDHLAGHPGIPANLIEELQHGDSGDTLTGTTVLIDGQRVHVAVSSKGTGIPEPDSQGVWDALTATYRDVSASPYCADVVRPLPQEIAAVGWTTAGGQTVNVTPCKTTRLRGIFGIALFPLARAGEIVTLSAATTSSAAAALVLGTSSLSPAPLPAEPAPDLQPKTGIAQRIPQVASTIRPEPAKGRGRARTTTTAKVATQTSAPRPATTPTRTARPKPPPSLSPVPTKQAATTPKPPEAAPPAVPARPTGAGLETLLPSLTSLLRDRRE